MILNKSKKAIVKILKCCPISSLLSQLYLNPIFCLLTSSVKKKSERDIHFKSHSRELDMADNLILVIRKSWLLYVWFTLNKD